MRGLLRRRDLVAVLIGGLMAGGIPRHATAQVRPAEAADFVANLWLQAYDSLSDVGVSDGDRARRFQALLNAAFDVPLLAQAALGRYWRQLTDNDRVEYLKLFEENLVLAYSDRFKDYSGESLRVVQSRASQADEAQVTSEIPRPGLGPFHVAWRLRRDDNTFKVIDLIVEGVSMVLTQRDDFAAVIQRANGRIDALLSSMREKLIAASAPPPSNADNVRTTPVPNGSEL